MPDHQLAVDFQIDDLTFVAVTTQRKEKRSHKGEIALTSNEKGLDVSKWVLDEDNV